MARISLGTTVLDDKQSNGCTTPAPRSSKVFVKRGHQLPLGTLERFCGGHEQRPSLSLFTMILHNHNILSIHQSNFTIQWHFQSRSMNISYLNFGLKPAVFRLPYQHHSSSVDCAKELFNGSNGSASLLACTRKNFWLGVVDFLWVTS